MLAISEGVRIAGILNNMLSSQIILVNRLSLLSPFNVGRAMENLEEKIVSCYETSALGFPIIIHNVRMKKIRGSWCAMIKWNKLMHLALIALITKPSRLTVGRSFFLSGHI